MYQIAKRTGCAALILILMPIIIWVSGWRWAPGISNGVLHVFFWMTETVSSPWGILTYMLLCAWFLWCLRFRIKPTLVLLLILTVTLLLGQGMTRIMKKHLQEPRPYVQWLSARQHMDVKSFYAQKSTVRGQWINRQLANSMLIPPWLNKSWQQDTGFAFPSGHTMFAASWALLAVGLLWPRRRYKTMIVLMLWASLVMGSRLLLGMHWPRDLIASIAISWLLITFACWLAQKLCGPLTVPPQEQCKVAEHSDGRKC